MDWLGTDAAKLVFAVWAGNVRPLRRQAEKLDESTFAFLVAFVAHIKLRCPKKKGRHDCDLPVVSPGAFPVGKVRKAVGLVWWGLCRRCVCGFRVCRGLVVVGCCGLWWLSSFGCASACSCVVVRCGWRLSACRRYEFHRHSFHHRQLLSHSLRTTFEVFAL